MKPVYIEAIYLIAVNFSIEEVEKKFNIAWVDVKDFMVKYGVLILTMMDGTTHELDSDSSDHLDSIDWKRPDTTNLLSKDFEVIEDE